MLFDLPSSTLARAALRYLQLKACAGTLDFFAGATPARGQERSPDGTARGARCKGFSRLDIVEYVGRGWALDRAPSEPQSPPFTAMRPRQSVCPRSIRKIWRANRQRFHLLNVSKTRLCVVRLRVFRSQKTRGIRTYPTSRAAKPGFVRLFMSPWREAFTTQKERAERQITSRVWSVDAKTRAAAKFDTRATGRMESPENARCRRQPGRAHTASGDMPVSVLSSLYPLRPMSCSRKIPKALRSRLSHQGQGSPDGRRGGVGDVKHDAGSLAAENALASTQRPAAPHCKSSMCAHARERLSAEAYNN